MNGKELCKEAVKLGKALGMVCGALELPEKQKIFERRKYFALSAKVEGAEGRLCIGQSIELYDGTFAALLNVQ